MSNLMLKPSAFDLKAIFGNFVEEWYKYLALFLVIGIVITLCLCLKKKEKRNSLNKTQKIVYIAILSALSICCNTFLEIPLGNFKFSFTITIGFIAGYMLGGTFGFVVGFVSDLIGGIIMPQGVYNPLLALSSGLFGFFSGVLFTYFKGNDYVKVAIYSVIVFIVCSMFLNTLGLYVYMKGQFNTFWAFLVYRLPTQSINAAGNCAICMAMVAILPRILPKNKFSVKNEAKEQEIKGNRNESLK